MDGANARCPNTIAYARLIVVNDEPLACGALGAMLATMSPVDVVATTTVADEAPELAALHSVDVVLIDAALPGLVAFDVGRRIGDVCPTARLIYLDDTLCEAHVHAALEVGAWGYWTRWQSSREIAEGVRRVALGERAFCDAVAARLVRHRNGWVLDGPPTSATVANLTRRELEVLKHLSLGLSVKQCARQLDLAYSTVDNHKARLMKKLKVHNAVELARLAIREGLVGVGAGAGRSA